MSTKTITGKLVPMLDPAVAVVLACSWAGLMVALPYTVSMDSASHLYTSRVAMELLFKPDSPFNGVYELNSGLLPNWGTTWLLSFFNLLAPGTGAEQMLKLALPLLFGCALWSVLRVGSRHPIITLPLFYPLVFSFFFSAGFYGFYIGTGLMICALYFVLPNTAALSMRQALLLSLTLVVTYYFHLFTFALAAIFIGSCVLVDSVLDARRALTVGACDTTAGRTRKALSYGLTVFLWEARRVWLATLPALFLLAAQLRLGSAESTGFHLPNLRQLQVRLAESFAFEGPFNFIGWNPGLKIITVVFVLALFAFALAKKGRSSEHLWRREDLKLVALIGCSILLFLVMPDASGDASFIAPRFLYAAFLLMLLFAACHLSRKEAWVACLLVTLPFAYSQQRAVYRDAQTLEPYAVEIQNAARHVTPHSGVLTLTYNTKVKNFEAYLYEQAPLRHLDGYLAVRAQSSLINNYEGMTDFFPLRLRSELRSAELRTLQGEFLPMKSAALESFLSQHRDVVDYLVIWETDHGTVRESAKRKIRQLVSTNFHLVYQTQRPAPLYLYARSPAGS